MKKFLISIIFHFLSLLVFGQYRVELNERCKDAYRDIISLKFDTANSLLEQEQNENPENLFVPYLENYIDFLKMFISEDEDLFKKLEEKKTDLVELIENLDEQSPYRNYMIGNINLQWAVARLKFQEYFTAAFEINRAYRLLKDNDEKFPDFLPNKITFGVLHIMIGLVPENYRWILDIINMEGSIVEGKNELRTVLQRALEDKTYAYLKNETLFYLGFVELNIHPDEKKISYLMEQLEKSGNNNLMLDYLMIDILMRTGNNDRVLQKFDSLPGLNDYFPFYYLYYLEGESNLRKLETGKAADHLNQFVKNFKGQNYIKDAYRKLAWTFLLKNDTIGYQETILHVLDHGKTNVGQDNDAEREAQSGLIPDVELIKIRLLFDGGYYSQADSVLEQIDTTSLNGDEKIEAIYRKARIAHLTGDFHTAIIYYQKTIDAGKNSPRYFAGNAALKLGDIYESQGNLKLAEHYYRQCLDLDFVEYESGIHTKAKAALKRISG